MTNLNWAFFGTSRFAVIILDELKKMGYVPNLLVTVEDKPKGRKLVLTPPETKVWAQKENIPFLQFKTIRTPEAETEIKKHSSGQFDIFVVASYGKIVPKNTIEIPKHGTINVHPSLLPKLRGASPIQSAIIKENETGVSIIRLDEEIDHGPLLSQKKVSLAEWPMYEDDLERVLAEESAVLLSETIKSLLNGTAVEKEQDHSVATFCEKIEKSDGEINLDDDPEINLRKIMAYNVWPTAYYFDESKRRVIVKRAHIADGKLIIEKVIPEGKKEMSYDDYLRGKNSKK